MAITVTETWYESGIVKKLSMSCVCSTNGTATISKGIDGFIHRLVTNPASPAPSDNYDITIIDDSGLDVLQTLGMNRDTADTEERNIVYSGTSNHVPISYADTLTLTIAGNSQAAALTVIDIYYSPCS